MRVGPDDWVVDIPRGRVGRVAKLVVPVQFDGGPIEKLCASQLRRATDEEIRAALDLPPGTPGRDEAAAKREFRELIAAVGRNHSRFGRVFGHDRRTVRRWTYDGTKGPPEALLRTLRYMVKHNISLDDFERDSHAVA
jgi:hypothetical protein